MGSGVKPEKGLHNASDRIGITLPAVGLEAKVSSLFQIAEFQLTDKPIDAPVGVEMEPSLHGVLGGSVIADLDPGGTLTISGGPGAGLGGQITFTVYLETK